jgi:hypothetical protein
VLKLPEELRDGDSDEEDEEVALDELRALALVVGLGEGDSDEEAKKEALCELDALELAAVLWDGDSDDETEGVGDWLPVNVAERVAACDDDARPVLRVWDLRSSTTTPLCEL